MKREKGGGEGRREREKGDREGRREEGGEEKEGKVGERRGREREEQLRKQRDGSASVLFDSREEMMNEISAKENGQAASTGVIGESILKFCGKTAI